MALKGTLKDFGIADIFQLIGHQTKTGLLRLREDDDEVLIHFQDGAVVRAEESSRPRNELLGTMLVEAELITPEQLKNALEEQRETLQKLGTILVKQGVVTKEQLAQFTRLQLKETIHRLFAWSSGTYEFEQSDNVPPPEGVEPIRGELLLMEGVRMIDEWPAIRKSLPSDLFVPERLMALPPEQPKDELGFDAFGVEGETSEPAKNKPPEIGASERTIFELLASDRTIRKLAYLSQLGEFETCRALINLEHGGYIRIPRRKKGGDQDPTTTAWPLGTTTAGAGLRRVSYLMLVLVVAVMATSVFLPLRSTNEALVETRALKSQLAASHLPVIQRALEVYRMTHGRYPASLSELTSEELLGARDLRFPFEDPYVYRIEDGRYVLLPPIPDLRAEAE